MRINPDPKYRRRRRIVAAVAVTILAPAAGWIAGRIDNARILENCRTDPSGIYCTPEDQPNR